MPRYLFSVLLILLFPYLVDAGRNDRINVVDALRYGASNHQIPYRLLYGICKVESNLRAAAMNNNDSGSRSYGLCQIKLATARGLGFTGRRTDLIHPYTNAFYAARYVRQQLDRYNQDWVRAISAYNAGKEKLNVNHKYVHKVLKMTVEVR